MPSSSFAYTGLQAGALRHRVRIEQFGPVLDSSGDAQQDPATGEVEKSWQLVATVWADIRPYQAMMRVSADQIQSEVDVVITIRFRDGIDQTMRVVHGSRYYDITGVILDPDSGREWIQLPCKLGVSAG